MQPFASSPWRKKALLVYATLYLTLIVSIGVVHAAPFFDLISVVAKGAFNAARQAYESALAAAAAARLSGGAAHNAAAGKTLAELAGKPVTAGHLRPPESLPNPFFKEASALRLAHSPAPLEHPVYPLARPGIQIHTLPGVKYPRTFPKQLSEVAEFIRQRKLFNAMGFIATYGKGAMGTWAAAHPVAIAYRANAARETVYGFVLTHYAKMQPVWRIEIAADQAPLRVAFLKLAKAIEARPLLNKGLTPVKYGLWATLEIINLPFRVFFGIRDYLYAKLAVGFVKYVRVQGKDLIGHVPATRVKAPANPGYPGLHYPYGHITHPEHPNHHSAPPRSGTSPPHGIHHDEHHPGGHS